MNEFEQHYIKLSVVLSIYPINELTKWLGGWKIVSVSVFFFNTCNHQRFFLWVRVVMKLIDCVIF